ncbi:outer membrane protein assembly factor BamD [Pokkaliibacter sp. CJK22405]|uniref:outer membrane protein assembly factor BamD n=1 Tax=Pokkaliibacter sp. CJK22405 TaxID=3384615 RepID=UPI0039850AA8
MRQGKLLLAVAMATALAGCSALAPKEPDYSEQVMYDKATTALDDALWDQAADWYEKLEARYPFGRYSEQAQLELIYAYYRDGKEDETRAAADRFIRVYPNSNYIDYAYYVRGLTAFEQDQSLISRFLPTDETERDPGAAKDSYNDFATLVRLYPNSPYASDAKNRMVYLRNRLARYEIHVAQYYIKRGAYLAAANRGRYVVENFQETPAVSDALAVMIVSYNALGEEKLAKSAQDVLDLNYPGYSKNILDETSIIDKYSFGVFRKSDAKPDFSTEVKANTQAPAKPAVETPAASGNEEEDRSWFQRMTDWF